MNRSSWAKIGRAIVVDISPLREYRDFRYFFVSRFAFDVGRQLIVVALPVQVYESTGSSLAVGLVGGAQLVPILGVSLIGGALADAFDRRRLLVLGQAVTGVICAGLAVYASSSNRAILPVYLLAALVAGVAAVVQPTRTAVLPTLVRPASLPSALALRAVLANLTKAGVPAIGGLLIARTSLSFTYWLAAGLSVAAALVIRAIRALPPAGGGRGFGIESIREGLGYLRRDRLISSTLIIDLNAMVFGMPSALFPAMGTTVFGGDATTVGLLYSAPGIGALIAALTSGWLARVRRQGSAVVASVTIWGFAIAAFGLTGSLAPALLWLLIAGAADVVSGVFRNAVVQLTVPDALRGRISAVHVATVTSGPRLGDLEAGVIAYLTTPQVSVVSGGLACMLGTMVIARLIPELPRYRQGPPEEETRGHPR